MKVLLLALLWCGTAAWCQAPPSIPPMNPDKLFNMPEKFSGGAELRLPAFDKALADNSLPQVTILASAARPQNLQIDPEMIVRPPWPPRGDGQKGRDVSSNQFKNLRFLPVWGGAARGAVKAVADCR